MECEGRRIDTSLTEMCELYVALALSTSDAYERKHAGTKDDPNQVIDLSLADVLVRGLSSKANDDEIRGLFAGCKHCVVIVMYCLRAIHLLCVYCWCIILCAM